MGFMGNETSSTAHLVRKREVAHFRNWNEFSASRGGSNWTNWWRHTSRNYWIEVTKFTSEIQQRKQNLFIFYVPEMKKINCWMAFGFVMQQHGVNKNKNRCIVPIPLPECIIWKGTTKQENTMSGGRTTVPKMIQSQRAQKKNLKRKYCWMNLWKILMLSVWCSHESNSILVYISGLSDIGSVKSDFGNSHIGILWIHIFLISIDKTKKYHDKYKLKNAGIFIFTSIE